MSEEPQNTPGEETPLPQTVQSPSMTSVLRSADARISSKQIGIVMGLVSAVAAAVALFMSSQNAKHLESIERIHMSEVTRLEGIVSAAEDRVEAVEERSDRHCVERLTDIKESWLASQGSLDACLERAIEVTFRDPR
jgi:hypothetical protein